jgi:EAL domain-containing protein (putative c-di-GMP-specific phosphodiesterase class I)
MQCQSFAQEEPGTMQHYDPKNFVEAAPLADERGCNACREGRKLSFDFTMAFQPIVDLSAGRVWGYEALVRGEQGQGAAAVLEQVGPQDIYAFDQACRVKAIELAGSRLPADGATRLSINFKPRAVYEPAACIRATLAAARRKGVNPKQLMFEFTEDEPMRDVGHVRGIVDAYREFGFTTAIDDFGAGYAGLTLLAGLLPDLIKIDMALLRGIDGSAPRRAIVGGIVGIARELGIACLAEGLETRAEVEAVRSLGIDLCQGYYFARPETGALPEVRTLS